jgi:hypothetical protein
MERPTITAIVFQQGTGWVAQCSEINIAVSADRREDVPAILRKRLQGQMLLDSKRGVPPFSTFGRARDQYWKLLDEATPWSTQVLPEPFLARLLRMFRRVENVYRSVRLVGVSRDVKPEAHTEGLQAQLV